MTPRLPMMAVAAVLYGWMLTRGSFDPFGAEQFGLAFNSMLDHMLRGEWDVDPASIGFEGFVHDGRTYAYFGPIPAVLRLPLVLLRDWRTLHVERLSCWLAVMVGVAAQASAVATALSDAAAPVRQRLGPPLLLACALSGAPMLLGWKGALIYHEAILWAWALSMVFVAVASRAVRRPLSASGPQLCGLGVCAGLCLLTRSTTGAMLCLATGLLLLSALVRHARTGRQPILMRWSFWTPFWAPAGVLGGFVILTGVVNRGRWGNPLTFANLGMQTTLVERFPDRLATLQRHGLFDWHRLDIGLLYYVFPVWTEPLDRLMPLRDRLVDLYDAIELPASSLLLTDPAWCALAILGTVAILRGRAATGAASLAAGLSLAPAMMLMAWYLAFRYRVEFAPLLLLLACIGLADRASGLAPRALGRTRLALYVLCVLQIGSAMRAGLGYAGEPFGPTTGYAAFSLRCAVEIGSCAAGR